MSWCGHRVYYLPSSLRIRMPALPASRPTESVSHGPGVRKDHDYPDWCLELRIWIPLNRPSSMLRKSHLSHIDGSTTQCRCGERFKRSIEQKEHAARQIAQAVRDMTTP
jgi:hypothetical protein